MLILPKRRRQTEYSRSIWLNKAIYLTAVCLLLIVFAGAQPKPGKEKIVVPFPSEYRWKRSKIPKDTKAIRGTEYTVRGKNAENAVVQTVTVTTIDRRYYPMKAEGTPEEKWEFEKTDCPESVLEIVDKQVKDSRTTILFAIKGARPEDGGCGEALLLSYIAEGPTAFHTVELTVLENQLTPELFDQWCDTLLQSQIE